MSCTNNPRRRIQRQKSNYKNKTETIKSNKTVPSASRSRNISSIKMKQEGGVYLVPIEINGVPMEFVFDTGASLVCISEVEARFLIKQGKISDEDYIGEYSYRIADGSTGKSTHINLKSVKIGQKTLYNIKASIMPGQTAPLLLGQTVLSQFGEISIDYNRNILIVKD